MQIPDLTDVKDDAPIDATFIKTLEDILMNWETHIAKIIDDCLKKVCYFFANYGAYFVRVCHSISPKPCPFII